VLDNLLIKYADVGVQEIENMQVLKVPPFNEIGSLSEVIKKGFGGKAKYEQAIKELESEIYQTTQQTA
jgi:type I restriction enzyme R subunit